MPRTFEATITRQKAKHPANQAGLDRLQELYVKAMSNPNAGQNYAATIKRAMKSLRECKEPILTQKDAIKLKYIGPAMAKKICPQSTGVGTSKATKPNKSKSTGKSKATTKGRNDENDDFHNFLSGDYDVAPSDVGPPPTGLPLVCPYPTIPSTLQRTSSFESSSTAKEQAYTAAKAEAERLVLPPRGPWKVILLVDIREHKSKQVVSSCKQAGIPCEERQLAIGDMAWIARCVVPNESGTSMLAASAGTSKKRKKAGDDDKFRTIEILVGTIVERKEVNDLASSLFGTRYAEQRLRLSQSGLPQVLFLVEGNLSAVDNCPAETLQMAMMETRINLGFQIVHTKHLTETVNTLKTLHSRIVQRTFPDAFGKSSTGSSQQIALPSFGGGNSRRGNRRASSLLELVFDTAPVPPFGSKRFITYPELKAKVEVDRERGTRSVRAISLAMLKQIPTLSQKKCTAIANHYPTLNQLLTALSYPTASANGQKYHPKKVVQEIEIDSGRRTIGPKSASEIYAACCTLQDGSTVACHEKDIKQAPVDVGQPRISSFLSGASAFDKDNTNNRKSPPITETNVSKPPASSQRERPLTKKARAKDTSAGAKTTVSNVTNSQLCNLESSGVPSPEGVPRAFSTRKRPAPVTTTESSGDSSPDTPFERNKKQSNYNHQNHSHLHFGSPLRRKQSQIQETVDLLTPESNAKPKAKPASAKNLAMLDFSDSSDSSDDVCDTLESSRKSNPLATATNFGAKNDNIAKVAALQKSNLKKQGISHKQDALLLSSSDEGDSPFPKNITMAGTQTNRDESKLKYTNRATSAKAVANRLSLDTSPGDSSFLFSSPDENILLNQRKTHFGASQNNVTATTSRGQTNTSGKDNKNDIVCLLDDSDDESSCDTGEGLVRKDNTNTSGEAFDLPMVGKRNAFVTTTRGGALPSTQERRYGDDSEKDSSDEDLEFGTSLRERLGAIRGQDLKEVIELDSDSE